MTLAALLSALSSIGDVAILVIAYFIYSIKHNHLPHIYERLGEVEKSVAFNRGQLTKPICSANNDTDRQIGPNR